jgi:hypothetical protein
MWYKIGSAVNRQRLIPFLSVNKFPTQKIIKIPLKR